MIDVVVSGVDGTGELRLDLKTSGTGIIDAAGSAIGGGFSVGQSYQIVPAPFRLVRDINTLANTVGAQPQNLIHVNGLVFFIAQDPIHGKELWKSDGTMEGTVLVKDIFPGSTPSNPAGLVSVGNTVFFQANDGVHGAELWKSDGTTAGTLLVKDINPGLPSSPSELVNVNGTLFFQADDGSNGVEPGGVCVRHGEHGPGVPLHGRCRRR